MAFVRRAKQECDDNAGSFVRIIAAERHGLVHAQFDKIGQLSMPHSFAAMVSVATSSNS
jgi:hypothetical protein